MKTELRILLPLLVALLVIRVEADGIGSRTRSLPKTGKTFTNTEWTKIVQNLKPKIDSKNAIPIRQPSNSGKVANKATGFIVGGAEAAAGQFPWQAALIVDSAWLCGGSLIMADWVLTAGHCAGKSYMVILGSISRNPISAGGVQIVSNESFVHEKFDSMILNNDLMLVKLPEKVNLTDNLKTVALPKISDASETFEGTLATVSGFGLTSDASKGGSTSITLKFVQVNVISNSECAQFYGPLIILSSSICTKQVEKSTCQGDSGGPLVTQDASGTWIQIGVVSFGSSFGCLEGPSGFARVSSFLSWISGTIYGNATEEVTTQTQKPVAPIKPGKKPKCSASNFQAMSKCCGSPPLNLVKVDKVTKSCRAKSRGGMHIFNSYLLNKQQNDLVNNTVDFNSDKVKKALGKDACLVNCYLDANGVILSNGSIDADAMATLIAKNQVANSPQADLVDAAVHECHALLITEYAIPNFVGKSSCDGTGAAILQCVHFSLIAMCPDPKTQGTKCMKDYGVFDFCSGNILNSLQLKTRISSRVAARRT